jgi:hypothetical protein
MRGRLTSFAAFGALYEKLVWAKCEQHREIHLRPLPLEVSHSTQDLGPHVFQAWVSLPWSWIRSHHTEAERDGCSALEESGGRLVVFVVEEAVLKRNLYNYNH